MARNLPFARLGRAQWERLFDFAAWVVLCCFLLYVGWEAYWRYGVDLRGYYAAARVVLVGGDPYDYDQVSRVLLAVTGEMGNNPYYYAPWFSVVMTPLALLPFRLARLVWIALTLGAYWLGTRLALDVLDWQIAGWRRWLLILGGAYLFVWISVRSEQLGTWLFALIAASLWGYRREKPLLAGAAMALLLTKPNVTWLTVPTLGLVYWQRQRRAVWWAAAVLFALLLVSTAIVPAWPKHLTEPDFGAGLRFELDGPDRIKSIRLNTVLRDWLGQWTDSQLTYWLVWGLLAVGSGWVLWRARRAGTGEVYRVALSSALGLLLTPYAMQYDYPPLALAFFWIGRSLPWDRPLALWGGLSVLAFVFSVPLWEWPVYDGYWMLLGIVGLLVSCNASLWSRKRI
jgi:hypothetical protein